MKVIKIIDATIATATPVSYSAELEYYDSDGLFAVEVKSTGGGSLQIECLGSISGIEADMVVPNGMSDVVAAHTAGTGIYNITPGMPLAKLQLKFTATVADVPTEAWLLID